MAAAEQVEKIFREEHGRVPEALISQFEDFDLAEDSLQDALVRALKSWETDGIPHHPGAWLTTVARLTLTCGRLPVLQVIFWFRAYTFPK